MTVQAGLCQTWSETQIVGFLCTGSYLVCFISLYQGGDNETSFGDESGGETEPLLPPPVENNATRTRTPGRSDAIQISFRSDTKEISMEDSKDAIEIDLVEPQEKKQGITRERVFVVLTILLTELCERLTYYSVVANMVLFCTSVLDMSSDDASVVTLIFSGLYYRIHESLHKKTNKMLERKNKGTDHSEADQRLCFHFTDSAIPLLLKSKISSF